jgi:DNA-binding NarL/FixJ family response regulator
MIRLLLADDEPHVRRGLRMRLGLERDLVVVGEAHDGAEAVRLADKFRPDVVLMDLRMPGLSGMAATEALHPLTARSAVVIHSFRDDPATRAEAQAAGAFAFVAKGEPADALLAAIRQAAWQPEDPSSPAAPGGERPPAGLGGGRLSPEGSTQNRSGAGFGAGHDARHCS